MDVVGRVDVVLSILQRVELRHVGIPDLPPKYQLAFLRSQACAPANLSWKLTIMGKLGYWEVYVPAIGEVMVNKTVPIVWEYLYKGFKLKLHLWLVDLDCLGSICNISCGQKGCSYKHLYFQFGNDWKCSSSQLFNPHVYCEYIEWVRLPRFQSWN